MSETPMSKRALTRSLSVLRMEAGELSASAISMRELASVHVDKARARHLKRYAQTRDRAARELIAVADWLAAQVKP